VSKCQSNGLRSSGGNGDDNEWTNIENLDGHVTIVGPNLGVHVRVSFDDP